MHSRRWVAVAAALTMYCAVSAGGQEKKLKKSDLPAAVRKTADEQSKGATVRGYSKETEDGKLEYEVQLTVNGHGKDITMDPQGNVMEIEEEVDMKSPAGRGARRAGETGGQSDRGQS
jgi:hypothetical protein